MSLVGYPFQSVVLECGVVPQGLRSRSGIVGGDEAVPYSHPWQIQLRLKNGSHWCGGSILSDKFVITAAHCVVDWCHQHIVPVSADNVVAGEHDLTIEEGFESDHEIENVYCHPERADAAIIRLSNPIKLTGDSKARPICLPAEDDLKRFDRDTKLEVSGWGDTKPTISGRHKADKLKELTVPWISNAECNAQSDRHIP